MILVLYKGYVATNFLASADNVDIIRKRLHNIVDLQHNQNLGTTRTPLPHAKFLDV